MPVTFSPRRTAPDFSSHVRLTRLSQSAGHADSAAKVCTDNAFGLFGIKGNVFQGAKGYTESYYTCQDVYVRKITASPQLPQPAAGDQFRLKIDFVDDGLNQSRLNNSGPLYVSRQSGFPESGAC